MPSRIVMILVCLSLSAQVSPVEERFYRDGGGALEYICTADAKVTQATFSTTAAQSSQPGSSIATAKLTQIVVASNVATVTTSGAHGYAVGQRIQVRGATVDTDLNGDYTIASSASGTTFTFATANVSDATYNEAGLRFLSTAPRTNSRVWLIEKLYNTSTNADRHIYAHGSGARDKACDSRTTYF